MLSKRDLLLLPVGTKLLLCGDDGVVEFCGSDDDSFKVLSGSFLYNPPYCNYGMEPYPDGTWEHDFWVELIDQPFIRWQEVGF